MTRSARALAIAALALLLPACSVSYRTGEVDVLKVAPSGAAPRADRTSGTYVLKGRYFSLSDNAFRIMDAFQEFDHVGPLRLLREAERVQEEALRAAVRAEAADAAPRAELKRLRDLAERARRLAEALGQRTGTHDPALGGLHVQPFFALELDYERLAERLSDTERFLEHLRDSVADVRRERSDPVLDRGPTFEIIFEVAGAPLARDAWDPKNNETGHRLMPAPYRTHFERLRGPVEALLASAAALTEGKRPRFLLDEAAEFRASAVRLEPMLRRILEWALDLSYAVRRGKSAVAVHGEPTLRPYELHLDYLNLEIQKALRELALLLRLLREPMRQLASTFIAERVELEGLAAELAQRTRRHYHRPIEVPKAEGVPPPYLTVLLKTLFVRFLDEPPSAAAPEKRCAELLVTCAVKHHGNAEDAVYPLIFETDFAPGHFVNRFDRIVYGPYPYQGEFLDFRLTVVELDDLDNAALLNGISQATSAVGAFNPELAVLSPAVTALFGTLIKNVSENDRELDASFTFPGVQGAGKPDVDMLLNETGHYVVLKRENAHRPERLGRAAQEMLYRKLIYNAEDGKLYWRRYFSDARSNFTPDNLFKDQTYAVVVVTDEYDRGDDLGAVLRKQVGRALGEAKAREVIPDLTQSAKLLQRYHDLRKDKRELRTETLGETDRKIAEERLAKQQEELWRESTELNQQMLVEALYDRATDDARQELGRDLEKWKRAEFQVDADGRLHLKKPVARLDERHVEVPGPALAAFDAPGDGRTWTYRLLDTQGTALPEAVEKTPSAWPGLGSVDEKGRYTPPEKPSAPSVLVRARGAGKPAGADELVQERRMVFTSKEKLAFKLFRGNEELKLPLEAPILLDGALQLKATTEAKVKWHVDGTTVSAEWKEVAGSPVKKAAVKDGTLAVDLLPGRSPDALHELTILAVREDFEALLKDGRLDLYPHQLTRVPLENPLSFDPPQVEVETDAQGAPVRIVRLPVPKLKGPQASALKEKPIPWRLRLPKREIELESKLDEPLPLEAGLFTEDELRSATGTLEIYTPPYRSRLRYARRSAPN